MPKKTVREMNAFERMHYSLAARTFHAVVMAAFVIGTVALLIGLGAYTYAISQQEIGDAFAISKSAYAIIRDQSNTNGNSIDIKSYAKYVKTRYDKLTKSDRKKSNTDEYYEIFSGVEKMKGYEELIRFLDKIKATELVDDLYVGYYDRKTSSIVYIADPDTSATHCAPGTFEKVERRELNKFLNWNGQGSLYDAGNTEEYGWIATAGYPYCYENGEPSAFILADVSLGGVATKMRHFVLVFSIALMIIVLIIALILTRHMKKTLVEPINKIVEAAKQYVDDKRNGASENDHFLKLNIRTGDEVENLAFIMSDMEQDLNSYENHLQSITAEKERIGTELALATKIQADMLPSIFPAFPDRNDFDIYATMTPAKEVGGDFYDFFLVDDTHLGLVMADVSGKGVPAALFMMVSKSLIQSAMLGGNSPADALIKVNEQICAREHEGMFVTVWLGVLDLKTGKLTASNAGHEFPVIKKKDGDYEFVHDKHHFVVGGMPGIKYENYELDIEKGEKIFVYTDGVPEATDANKQLFGPDRLIKALNNNKDTDTVGTLETVDKAVKVFVGDAEQFDDLTMMCVEYMGDKKMKELNVEATIENVPKVTEFVDNELESLDCPMKAQAQIDVAIDELFSNIAKYAYNPEVGPATVRVEVEDDPLSVIVTFIDNGTPYDPLNQEDPDTTLSLDERGVGGLGVLLVKKTMDDVNYEYKDGKNILSIKKAFE